MKRKLYPILIGLTLLVGLIASYFLADRVAAQSGIDLIRWVFSGGGSPAAGGDVELNGSIGQAVAGSGQGGDASLSGGYWSPDRDETPTPTSTSTPTPTSTSTSTSAVQFTSTPTMTTTPTAVTTTPPDDESNSYLPLFVN